MCQPDIHDDLLFPIEINLKRNDTIIKGRCPADISKVVAAGNQTAVVSWQVYGGNKPVTVNATLSMGKHTIQFELDEETVCKFTVTIGNLAGIHYV